MTLLQLCQNYMTLCVRISKIGLLAILETQNKCNCKDESLAMDAHFKPGTND
jgi:hypothetical protein